MNQAGIIRKILTGKTGRLSLVKPPPLQLASTCTWLASCLVSVLASGAWGHSILDGGRTLWHANQIKEVPWVRPF